jgi:hypothetical protein
MATAACCSQLGIPFAFNIPALPDLENGIPWRHAVYGPRVDEKYTLDVVRSSPDE